MLRRNYSEVFLRDRVLQQVLVKLELSRLIIPSSHLLDIINLRLCFLSEIILLFLDNFVNNFWIQSPPNFFSLLWIFSRCSNIKSYFQKTQRLCCLFLLHNVSACLKVLFDLLQILGWLILSLNCRGLDWSKTLSGSRKGSNTRENTRWSWLLIRFFLQLRSQITQRRQLLDWWESIHSVGWLQPFSHFSLQHPLQPSLSRWRLLLRFIE